MRNLKLPHERLLYARVHAGFDKATDAARKHSFNENTYRSHENGARGITTRSAQEYAEKFKVRAEWILYGTEPMSGDASPPGFSDSAAPIYAYASAENSRSAINDGDVIGYLDPMPGMGKDGFYLIVHGDSMEPKLEQGIKIGVSRQVPPRKGKLCVVKKIDGEPIVKEFISKNEKNLICRQTNPEKKITFDMREVLEVLAVVGTVDY